MEANKEWNFNSFNSMADLTKFLNERKISQNEFKIVYRENAAIQYLLIYFN